MATRMQQRRALAASWTADNETLADGQIGIEEDTHKIKVGDGARAWVDLPYSTLTPTDFDALGDILVGTGANQYSKLSRGTTGQRLIVQADGTLAWKDSDSIPLATIAAAGDIVVGTGAGAAGHLTKGGNGQWLTVAGGALVWSNLPATALSADVPIATVTAAGDLIVGSGSGAVTHLAKGANGQVLGVTAGNLVWVTPSADIPLSTIAAAGDLVVGSGAGAVAKLAKGANGQYLSVVGGVLTWVTPSADIPLSTIAAVGDLIVGTGAGAVGHLGIGSAGQLLGIQAGTPQWQDPPIKGRTIGAYLTSSVAGPNSNAETNIISTAAATIVNGRRYKARIGVAFIKSDNSTDQVRIRLRSDTALTGSLLWDFWYLLWAATLVAPLSYYEVDILGAAATNLTPTNGPIQLAAGNHTFHLSMIKNSGASGATLSAVGSNASPTMLTIDDVGL